MSISFKSELIIRKLSNDNSDSSENENKTKGLMSKNNSFVHVFQILLHFVAILYKTSKWNDQIQGFVENMNAWRQIFHSVFLISA